MRSILKHILVIINIFVALLLLGSTLAGSTEPTKFIWFSLLSYCYFPLLLINVAFVVLWLFLSSKQFLISAIVIVVRWSFVPLFFQVGGVPIAPEGNTLKVMSFNAHHYYGRNYISDPKEAGNVDTNALAFLDLLRTENPEVICLQEYLPYTARVRVADSMQAMGYRYYAASCPALGHSASICWSKYPIVNTVYIDSSSKVQLDIVKEKDTVRIFSVHLNSYQLDTGDIKELHKISHGMVHKYSGRAMLHKVKETVLAHDTEWMALQPLIETSPYPCIVAGDFNDTPASYFYQRITQILNDSYKERGKGFCTTYHGRFPTFRIDYILHSPSLKALSYKRVKSKISDHYPIIVTLEMEK